MITFYYANNLLVLTIILVSYHAEQKLSFYRSENLKVEHSRRVNATEQTQKLYFEIWQYKCLQQKENSVWFLLTMKEVKFVWKTKNHIEEFSRHTAQFCHIHNVCQLDNSVGSSEPS